MPYEQYSCPNAGCFFTRILSSFWESFKFLFIFSFVLLAGCLFVSFAVMLGKYELITLVVVILLGAMVRSLLSEKVLLKLDRLPVIGEAIDVYNDLQEYYLRHKPKLFLYYLFYPISGTISFLFSREGARRELNAYFGLIQWILFLLLIEGFASYFRIYQYFTWDFALNWFYLELLCVYFLCNFFAVPVTTSSLNLGLAQKRIQLFALTIGAFGVLGFFFYFFAVSSKYNNLIPINIILNHRIAQSQNDAGDDFLPTLLDSTTMFLKHHCPAIIKFNQANYLKLAEEERFRFWEKLNQNYQKHLSSITVFGENDYFFITATQEYEELWGLIFLPFRDSVFYVFSYREGHLKVYSRWDEVSERDQKELMKKWDKNIFQLSLKKQFARATINVLAEKLKFRAKKSEAAKEIEQALPPSFEEKKNIAFDKMQDREELKTLGREEQKKLLQELYEESMLALKGRWETCSAKLERRLGLPSCSWSPEAMQSFLHFWRSWDGEEQKAFLSAVENFQLTWAQNLSLESEIIKVFRLWLVLRESLQKAEESDDKQIQLRKDYLEAEQKLDSLLLRLQDFIANIQKFNQELEIFDKNFDTLWKEVKQRRPLFTVYNKTLQEFDYFRAMGMKLLDNHVGKMPQLQQHWFTTFYTWFFSAILLVFQISMPLHIWLILSSHVSYCSPKY